MGKMLSAQIQGPECGCLSPKLKRTRWHISVTTSLEGTGGMISGFHYLDSLDKTVRLSSVKGSVSKPKKKAKENNSRSQSLDTTHAYTGKCTSTCK